MNIKATAYTLATTAYLFASAPKAFADEDTTIRFYGDIFEFSSKPQDLVAFFVNAAFVVAILLALVYLIWGGINWIMSGGDKEKVGAARQKIIAAIVGLILVILAYVILNFVLVIMTGSGINGLQLPTLMGEDGANPKDGVIIRE